MTPGRQPTPQPVGPGAGAVVFALLVMAVLLAPWLGAGSLAVSMLTQIAWLSTVLLANNLLMGRCGLLSFGHALQVGAGAVSAVYAMRAGWPLPLVPLAGGLGALLPAVLLGFVATRSAGTVFAMVTLALGELAAGTALMVPAWFGGEGGLAADRVYGRWAGLDFADPRQVFYLALLSAAACGWALHLLGRTALGRLMVAVRDNPERAAFLGHDPRRVRWVAYALAGFFGGVGGAVGAIQFEIVSTPDAVGLARSGSYLLFTYLGGSAHFFGPMAGAVLMVLTGTLLAHWSPAWPLYLGLIFLGTVLLAPSGLAGSLLAAPAAVRRSGWLRSALVAAAALLAAGGLVAGVELAYRWRWGFP